MVFIQTNKTSELKLSQQRLPEKQSQSQATGGNMLSKAMHELLGQVEELARFANTPVGMARAVMHQICVVGVMCPLWRRLGKFI